MSRSSPAAACCGRAWRSSLAETAPPRYRDCLFPGGACAGRSRYLIGLLQARLKLMSLGLRRRPGEIGDGLHRLRPMKPPRRAERTGTRGSKAMPTTTEKRKVIFISFLIKRDRGGLTSVISLDLGARIAQHHVLGLHRLDRKASVERCRRREEHLSLRTRNASRCRPARRCRPACICRGRLRRFRPTARAISLASQRAAAAKPLVATCAGARAHAPRRKTLSGGTGTGRAARQPLTFGGATAAKRNPPPALLLASASQSL